MEKWRLIVSEDKKALFAHYAGRRVVIPAPSYQVLTKEGRINHARREAAFAALESLGMIPTLMGGCFEQTGRFAGTDQRRAEDFMTALTQTDADLVMALRGGYGMTRLLPLLDWEALGRATTPMVGFSDFTAFNLALLARTGRPSWHGPMATSFIDAPEFTLERFSVVFGGDPGALTWRPEIDLLGAAPEGECSGTLWGGNLCLLASLAGTPWMPKVAHEGGILFLEDVAEPAYKVERMLLSLLEAGILGAQRAVLLGDFSNADDAVRFEGDHTLCSALRFIRSRLPASIPMVTGLPFGHEPVKATLPVGAPARLTFGAEGAGLTWTLPPGLVR